MQIPTALACSNDTGCVWNNFSLSAVAGKGIVCNDENSDYAYVYTPCSNGAVAMEQNINQYILIKIKVFASIICCECGRWIDGTKLFQ